MMNPHFQERKTLLKRTSLLNHQAPQNPRTGTWGFIVGPSPEPVNSVGGNDCVSCCPGRKRPMNSRAHTKEKEEKIEWMIHTRVTAKLMGVRLIRSAPTVELRCDEVETVSCTVW